MDVIHQHGECDWALRNRCIAEATVSDDWHIRPVRTALLIIRLVNMGGYCSTNWFLLRTYVCPIHHLFLSEFKHLAVIYSFLGL
jgi:hypothetical protein